MDDKKKAVICPTDVGEKLKVIRKVRPDIIVSVPDGNDSAPEATEITKIVDAPVQDISIKEEPKSKEQKVIKTEEQANYLHVENSTVDPTMSFYTPKETVQLKIKRMDPFAYLPEKKTRGAAAFDLFALEDCVVEFGRVTKVRTGIAIEVPPGYKGEVYSRSGFASQGVFVINQPGKIDCDYRGEIFVLLTKCAKGEEPTQIERGNRIAQLELQEVVDTKIVVVDELSATERGEGGLGSTGK